VLVRLKLEMNEYPSEVFVILLHTMVQLFDMALVQESQNLFLELPAAFAGDDLDQGDLFVKRFLHNAVQFHLDLVSAVIDLMQIKL
jgi:hypothetical protein